MNSSLHAWALKQGQVALNQLHGLSNAIQNVLSAADKVNTGQVGLNCVKESYCHCNTEQLRRETYHVCMDCIVQVPLNSIEESVERCISFQQCLVECLEEDTASATADPDSDP